MNLADPDLELLDPTPNIHSLFLHFDKIFFWSVLSRRCVVRWSKRMYSCAGTCSYEGRGGLCDIALSEPLLKLRPRKDLVETLLHEMIHAFLFVTKRDQDRDGHGPNFQMHMNRINRAAGLNISIYHDFHEEVELYQNHWWRCNGRCQMLKPHFGIVRRTCNRPPGPSDYWWNSHQKFCGGIFIKIKEPVNQKKGNKTVVNKAKQTPDITKYINTNNNNKVNNNNNKVNNNNNKVNNNNNKVNNNNNIVQNDNPKKPLSDISKYVAINTINCINTINKVNNNITLIVNKKNVIFNPKAPEPKSFVFNGKGQTVVSGQPKDDKSKRTSSTDVFESVKKIWSNKQIGTNNAKQVPKDNSNPTATPNKPKSQNQIPPQLKILDDYIKAAASSTLLTIYGKGITIVQPKNNDKLQAVCNKDNLVDCPVCNSKIDSDLINRHLDECLNKEIINSLLKDNAPVANSLPSVNIGNIDNSQGNGGQPSKVLVPGILSNKDSTKGNQIKSNSSINKNLINSDTGVKSINRKRPSSLVDSSAQSLNKMLDIVEAKNPKLRKTISYKVPAPIQIPPTVTQTFPTITNPIIKTEPGCSTSTDNINQTCPCCGIKLTKSINEHLEECLSFFKNNATIPAEGASTSYETIVIDDDDDDDEFDESQVLNATGTKWPCPCCLKMIEEAEMNSHLDVCLS